MIQLVDKMIFDIVGVTLIVIGIKILYLKRYTKLANNYIKNQLSLMLTSSIVCILNLNIFFNLENNLNIDALYLKGIGLAIFLGVGGILTNILYNKFFKEEESKYNPTDEEYLFIITVSFICATAKRISDGLIGFSIPVAILLGRFLWLDTKDLYSIMDTIKVNHHRINESAILFGIGMLLISICMHFLEERYYFVVLIAFAYVLVINYPYCFVITRIDKKETIN